MDSDEYVSLERQLQAVGHILDQRGPLKEVLVHQADNGFLVHAFAVEWGREQTSWSPVTIVVEASEFQAALAHLAPPEPAQPAMRRWWR